MSSFLAKKDCNPIVTRTDRGPNFPSVAEVLRQEIGKLSKERTKIFRDVHTEMGQVFNEDNFSFIGMGDCIMILQQGLRDLENYSKAIRELERATRSV